MRKTAIIGLVVLIIALVAFAVTYLNTVTSDTTRERVSQQSDPERGAVVAPTTPSAPSARPAKRVPAHFTTAPSAGSLAPSLAPERFTGRARDAYRAVREIPETIAQLPCYCYCDTNFNHKSLHSCFEDDHGSECRICIDEALLAYQLQKERNMTPAQIREQVIAKYGKW